jgi:hypothetical protein
VDSAQWSNQKLWTLHGGLWLPSGCRKSHSLELPKRFTGHPAATHSYFISIFI